MSEASRLPPIPKRSSSIPRCNEKSRLDEAARVGWLYFIAGHTQDEIA